MHEPAILLLDEPTSGLDVRSRHEFFELLRGYCQASGTTVVLATHLMEEAELCDQLVLLNHGHHVASGSPADLKASLQGDRLTVHCHHRDAVERFCRESLGCELTVRSADELSGRVSGAGDKVQRLLAECKAHIESVYVSRPTLEDVFLDLTGAPLHPQETQL